MADMRGDAGEVKDFVQRKKTSEVQKADTLMVQIAFQIKTGAQGAKFYTGNSKSFFLSLSPFTLHLSSDL